MVTNKNGYIAMLESRTVPQISSPGIHTQHGIVTTVQFCPTYASHERCIVLVHCDGVTTAAA
jgi:hypothetical protein